MGVTDISAPTDTQEVTDSPQDGRHLRKSTYRSDTDLCLGYTENTYG